MRHNLQNPGKWVGLALLGLAGTASAAVNDSPSTAIDSRLVGVWQGERDTEAHCKYQARSVQRLPNGKYVITYYGDPSKSVKIAEEKGIWWAADKTLFMQPPGSAGKPEAYKYYFIDKNTVRFENVEMDLSAECPADHTLIDSRVVQE